MFPSISSFFPPNNSPSSSESAPVKQSSPSVSSFFPPNNSPSSSESAPVKQSSPPISSLFPPNNSPSSSESAPVKQSSPSISLLFPPIHSQSNSLSNTRTINELANSICSIFRPNYSHSSSSESSRDQVTSKRIKLDEFEDVASSYIEGLDQLPSGLLQQQKPFIQAPQPFHQLQMLAPQHQQQLLLAQQNLTSPSASDESRRLRMLLSSRSMSLGKESLTNSVGDVVPNVRSPLQAASPLLSRGDAEMLIKLKMAQLQQQQQQQNSNPQQQQQQQLQQHALSNQQSQSSNHNLHQQDKMGGAASVTMDDSLSNSFQNDQGLDQLRSGLFQQQKPLPFHQLQMLTPQHQQQLLLAQQNLTSPSASDESRRLRMLLSSRSMSLGKESLTNSVGDVVPNVRSPLQAASPLLRGDTEMLIKLKMAQLQQQQQQQNSNPQQQQQQQLQQHALSNQQSQSSNHNLHQQDKMGGAASVTMDGSVSNSFRNDQGLDQLRSGLLQQQKPFIQAPQPFHQLQMLTPQHQQQLLLAQQNLTSPSASDESRRLRMLLSSRSTGDTEMLIKLKMAQLQQQQQQQNSNPQQQQQLQQHALLNQQSQSSNHNLHQQDKMGGAASVTMDDSMSNSF